jgi:hypothetical protein
MKARRAASAVLVSLTASALFFGGGMATADTGPIGHDNAATSAPYQEGVGDTWSYYDWYYYKDSCIERGVDGLDQSWDNYVCKPINGGSGAFGYYELWVLNRR